MKRIIGLCLAVLMLCGSIALVGLGIVVYVTPGILTNPIEGLTAAVAWRLKWPFYRAKILTDCLSVAVGVALCLLFLDGLIGIREGTVISAVLTGKAVQVFSLLLEPALPRLWGGRRRNHARNKQD